MKYKNSISRLILTVSLCLAVTLTALISINSFAAENPFSPSYLTASQPTLASWEKLTITIHLVNASSTAAIANVSNKIPAELAYLPGSASAGGVYNSQITLLTWDNVKVPASGETVLTFQVKPAILVSQAMDVINRASIQLVAEDGLGHISNPAVMITLLAGEPPEPSLVNAFKHASQSSLSPGQTLTYTIQVTNSGPNRIEVNVNDPLPVELEFVPGTETNGGVYDPNFHQISWRSIGVEAMSETLLSFDVTTAQSAINQSVEVVNTATVQYDDELLKPEVKINLVPAPLASDQTQPLVYGIVIGDKDVITDPNTNLHILASEDARWMFLQEYTVTTINGEPAWKLDASSGWIPYQAILPWTLSNKSGVHYIGLVVADENLNVSWYSHTSFDFVNLNLPGTATDEAGLIPYQVYYPAGVDVSLTLTPLSGNSDLYVWFPGDLDHPADQTSLNLGTAVDQINFTTPTSGVYIIIVHALEPVTYNLAISPAGGPTWQINEISTNQAPIGIDSSGAFTSEPIFSVIGLNPLGSASIGSPNFIRLPIIR